MPIFLLLLLAVNIFAHEQIILVLSDDFNSSNAHLYTFEKRQGVYQQGTLNFDVELGRNGLAWGLGITSIDHHQHDAIKKEGDGKAPAGVFLLGKSFGYQDTAIESEYIHATQDLICVDDVTSQNYNQLISLNTHTKPKSFEYMRRQDELYEHGLIIQHNTQAKKGAGSCIFMHIWRDKSSPTAGCTAMSKKNIIKLLSWLDHKKEPLLIQIPKQYCQQVQTIYPGLICREESFK